jgi:hypothetical protein
MAGPLLQHVPPVTQGGPLVSSDGSPHPTRPVPKPVRGAYRLRNEAGGV